VQGSGGYSNGRSRREAFVVGVAVTVVALMSFVPVIVIIWSGLYGLETEVQF